MAEEKLHCNSCNKRITNDPGRTIFGCPACGKEDMIRCSQCKKLAVKYKCSKCGFTGPN